MMSRSVFNFRGVAVGLLGFAAIGAGIRAQSTYADPYTFTTLAGFAGYGSTDGTGSAARFQNPEGVAVDASGNVYVADTYNHTIRKITPAGVVTTLAGTARSGGSMDDTGGAARFQSPQGVAVDASGNIYVADTYNHTIRKITPAGVVTTLAGTAGSFGSPDGTGDAARFHYPMGVAVDASGYVYVADTENQTIRKITPAGVVTTLAGTAGSMGLTDGTGGAARFNYPRGVAVDASGNVYVADWMAIRKISPGGVVTTLAGIAGTAGRADGTGSAAQFYDPTGVAVDTSGNVYVADLGNSTIRKITQGGVVTTLAGTAGISGSADATGGAAQFNSPSSVAVDASGNVYVADTYNHTVRKITSAGAVTTLAGTGGCIGSEDGPGSAARFYRPGGVAVDTSGNVYVADTYNDTVRKISPGGAVTTLAGTVGRDNSTDGSGSVARFTYPNGVAVDLSGNVYVADSFNSTIRKIAPGGAVSTLAGHAGIFGSADSTGSAALFNRPAGVAVDTSGNVYVADTYNHTIRKITSAGVVTTLAGTATSSGSADGTGSAAQFYLPAGVAVDASGNVYIADTYNQTIRKITPGGVVTTIAGAAGSSGSRDATGSAARFSGPGGVAVDASGNVYVADTFNDMIRKISPDGAVSTLAGLSNVSDCKDGTGSAASFSGPGGVAVDTSGNVYVADTNNHTIRKGFATPPSVTTPWVSSVYATSVTLGGNVTSNGGATITAFGVVFAVTAESSNPRIGGTGVTNVTGAGPIGAFTVDATGLTPNTAYTFAAYATNSVGTTYTTTGSFTTIALVPVISSSQTATGTYGSAISTYTITASYSPTSFNATGLPPGLSINTTNGQITGTPSSTSGSPYNVTISATKSGGTGSATLVYTISPVTLTVSGVTADNKIYNGTLATTINTGSASLAGIISGDTVTLNTGSATGTFASKDVVGRGIPVTVSGLTLSGASAGNYTLTQPETTATITPAALTVTGVTAADKIYDGGTTCTLNTGGAVLVGIVAGDTVTLNTGAATGTFASKAVGTGITVNITGLTLSGASAGNYILTQPTTTASISSAGLITLTVTGITASNKTYDGSTSATLNTSGATLVGVHGKDTVTLVTSAATGAFVSPGAGLTTVNVTGLTLSGAQASSYVLMQPATTATINPAGQTINFSAVGSASIGTPIALSATASSSLPVTFSVISGNASLVGSSLTLADANPVDVRATQAGNANYTTATADMIVSATAELAQTITFIAPTAQKAHASALTVTATASSGLPVTIKVTSGPAIFSGNTLTLTGEAGTVVLDASQAGNNVYAAARDVIGSFTVGPVGPQVFFGSTDNKDVIAASISADNKTGTIIGFLVGTSQGFVVNFKLNADGTFSAPATAFTGKSIDATGAIRMIESTLSRGGVVITSTLTFQGALVNGVITGSIVELALPFNAVVQPPAGSTAGVSGYYQASATNTDSGNTYSMVGTQGLVYVLAVTPTSVESGSGTLTANNTFVVQTSQNITITGVINQSTTTVTGTITIPGQIPTNFAGLSTTTTRTDRLINLSSRAQVGSIGGDDLITGFVIGGSDPKPVLLRAVGPGLTRFGVRNAVSKPRLILFDSTGTIVAQNVGWSPEITGTMNQVGAFPLTSGSADAALAMTLSPGAYTMQIVGVDNAGVALAEIYDASYDPQAQNQRLVNISSRGKVAAGDGVLIGGFVITGNSPKTVLIRGIGPSLTPFGVTGVLADPKLALYLGSTVIAQNDDWGTGVSVDSAQTAASAATIASAAQVTGAFALPANSKDSSVVVTLAPGTYTAQVSAANGGTGVALVEIYELP